MLLECRLPGSGEPGPVWSHRQCVISANRDEGSGGACLKLLGAQSSGMWREYWAEQTASVPGTSSGINRFNDDERVIGRKKKRRRMPNKAERGGKKKKIPPTLCHSSRSNIQISGSCNFPPTAGNRRSEPASALRRIPGRMVTTRNLFHRLHFSSSICNLASSSPCLCIDACTPSGPSL